MNRFAAIYVANADSRDIHVLRLDRAEGTVEPVQMVPAGGAVMPLAVSPDQRFLYASLRSEPFGVAGFAIDAATGTLTPIGQAPLPDSMACIASDHTGRWLFGASYGGHKASVSPIGADGVVQPASAVIPTGKNAHAVVIDATNRHLYVTNLGSDQVLHFTFDAATGSVTPADPPAFGTRPGAGPRHIALHPNGRHAYLLHELDATLDVLAVDADGSLGLVETHPTLPPGSDAKPWAADVHLTSDGRFVYTSERNSSTLAIWRVDPASGRVTLVGHQPTEQQPRGFQVDASGRWLVVVGQASHRLTAYRIDPDTGRLSPQASLPMGQNPNWVEIVDLP